MKKNYFKMRLGIILVLLIIVKVAFAQEIKSHQYSDAPDTVRYQILQSEHGARYTFKIDKHLGYVFQLVQGKDGITWQRIPHEDLPVDENKVNYQLFLSGLGPRYTFLLNVNSGLAWQLTEDTETGELFWNLFL